MNQKRTLVFGGMVALLAFLAGLYCPVRLVLGQKPSSRLTAGGLVAQAGQSDIGDTPAGTDLRPWEMLFEVMANIKRNFVRENVDERELTYGAVRGMLSALNDKYTRFLTPEEYQEFLIKNRGQFFGIGAQIFSGKDTKTSEEVLVVVPMDEGPAAKAGLKAGDRIHAIDGKSTRNMPVQTAVTMIRGERGTKVTLSVQRKPEDKPEAPATTQDITVIRDLIVIPAVESKLLDGGIALIGINDFNEKTDIELDRAHEKLKGQGIKGLIIDLRGNPGGLLDVAISVASRFVKSGKIVKTEGRIGNEDYHAETDRYWDDLKVPLVVLVDKYSASGSEIVAGAVQDHKAGTLVGVTTYGKGSVQLLVRLKNGGALAITTARYLTPNGRDINEKGVVPDIVVTQPDPAPGATGPAKDVQLERALEVVKSEIEKKNERAHSKDKSPKTASVTLPSPGQTVARNGRKP